MTHPTEQQYTAIPSIVATDLEDELVLLDPATQQIFSLNASGRAVWLALPASETQLSQRLTEAFDVTAEQAREDVSGLLRRLTSAGLVRAG
ncbi:PqqD family protein [Deinococcus aquiradiocola]|uniref:PqqD family protein n=1 Tax=Deinococcus aquiradiocola TaxID=393059 RepID=A0A917PG52_9DEIO|nr:PqqD family protein [Deinococcus aquiradiocola]GGJ75774.1 hypothetical protein GCM10008939_20020 [Deinococcus aquiradiocola]